MLKNDALVAKIGVDTAENELVEVVQNGVTCMEQDATCRKLLPVLTFAAVFRQLPGTVAINQ